MKTLIIFSLILGIFAAYFIFNAEKSISVKGGGNAIPAGTDIAKFILNKAKTIEPSKIISNIIGSNNNESGKIENISPSNITGEIISKAWEIKNKILNEGSDLLKQQIKDKAVESFCPQN